MTDPPPRLTRTKSLLAPRSPRPARKKRGEPISNSLESLPEENPSPKSPMQSNGSIGNEESVVVAEQQLLSRTKSLLAPRSPRPIKTKQKNEDSKPSGSSMAERVNRLLKEGAPPEVPSLGGEAVTVGEESLTPARETTVNDDSDPDVDSEHSRDHKRSWWHGGLWQTPRLMVDEDETEEEERQMTMTELFFDLVFVTAVARLGEDMKALEINLMEYIVYFLVVWTMWTTSTQYATRFHSDDMSHKVFFALYMIGLVGLAMHIQGGLHGSEHHDNAVGFALSAAFIRFLTGCYGLRIGYYLPEKALGYGVWTGFVQFSAVFIWLSTLVLDEQYRVYIWAGASIWHYIGLFSPSSELVQTAIDCVTRSVRQTDLILDTNISKPQPTLGLFPFIVCSTAFRALRGEVS